MTPRVSVLMTVYNGGRFLKPAVESILSSSLRDFEFVIVDNVSTDGSREYLRMLSEPRLRLIENERNLGQTGALNVGLRACSAPFVARLDADDLNEPDRLERQAGKLASDPGLGLTGGQTIAVDAAGRTLFRTRFPLDFETIKARMTLQNCFDHSSVAFRRDAALAVGGYPEDFRVSQDFALFSALLRAGYRMENQGYTASRVRMHPDQVMAQGAVELEATESIRVAAANQAWAAQRGPDLGLARTLHRLWSGNEGSESGSGDPDPETAIARFFGECPASARQKALLALFLLGGACDGRADLRFKLLGRALRHDSSIMFHGEFVKRTLRAVLPPRYLTRVRAMLPAQ
jgi:hypothetical protein